MTRRIIHIAQPTAGSNFRTIGRKFETPRRSQGVAWMSCNESASKPKEPIIGFDPMTPLKFAVTSHLTEFVIMVKPCGEKVKNIEPTFSEFQSELKLKMRNAGQRKPRKDKIVPKQNKGFKSN